MRATGVLEQEHEIILSALAVLSALADEAAAGAPVAEADARRVAAFFREFADGCHHVKEEEILFPALEDAGLPRHAGPVAVMLAEHDEGRAMLAAIDGAVGELSSSPDARATFVEAARAYAAHLGHHIQKENNILFRMADRVLAPDEERRVSEAFAERNGALQAMRERHVTIVKELAQKYLNA